MLIHDWMSTELITVTPETSMMKASKLLKDNKIRRLPVVDKKGRLVAIVTDRDINEASPSKATSLDVHELYYLLSEIKVEEIMVMEPYTAKRNDTVEMAARLMVEHHVGCLPVVDDDFRPVGIITESDIFKVFLEITGVKNGGVQFGVAMPNERGTLRPLLDDIRDLGASIRSVLTMVDAYDDTKRKVYIRLRATDRSLENKVVEAITAKYKLMYWARDNVHPILA